MRYITAVTMGSILVVLSACSDSGLVSPDINAGESVAVNAPAVPVSQQPTVPEESSAQEVSPSTEEVSETDEVMLPIVNLTTEFSVTPESNTSYQHAKFEFSAPDANGYLCRLGNREFEACDSGVFLVDVGLGQHTFDVQAFKDSNYGDVVSATWLVESLFEENNTELIATNVVPDQAEPNSWRGIIRINCDFAHSSYNDPIVFPNQENAAHLHRFYGNTLLDHTTTLESLYKGDLGQLRLK